MPLRGFHSLCGPDGFNGVSRKLSLCRAKVSISCHHIRFLPSSYLHLLFRPSQWTVLGLGQSDLRIFRTATSAHPALGRTSFISSLRLHRDCRGDMLDFHAL